jgi:plastocyanin
MRRTVALAVFFVAVSGAAPPTYKVVPVPNGGSIAGRVGYVGPRAERKEIMPTVDATVCGQHGMIQSDELVVSSSGGLQYAVVRLTNITAGRPASDIPPTVLLQEGCMFHPHVFAIPVGATVRERNKDGILHNVHTHSTRNAPVNFAHPGSAPEVPLSTFTAPESVKVTCDVHNWMRSWIWVSPHPYIAVTGPDGSYKITGVPPGQYRLEVWHESQGTSFREVTVAAGKESRGDFTLPLPRTVAKPTGTK